MRVPPGLAPLRERDFALYFAGQVLSHTGTALEVTTTAWLLYELTDSPVLLGLGGLFRALPLVVLIVLGGTFADRFPRRTILLVTQLGFIVSSVALGLLTLAGLVLPWHIYLFSAASSAFVAFDTPARQALFPSLVRRDQMSAAVSLNAVGARASTLVGPALAGIVIAGWGVGAAYLLNAASYLFLVAAVLAMRPSPPLPAVAGPLRAQVREVLVHVRADRILLPLLALETLASVFGHSVALLTIFARDVLDAGAQGLGLLRVAIAAGALVGMAVLIFAREIERKGTLLLGAGALYAVALAAFALSRSLWLSLALLVLVGLCDALWSATRNVVAQLVSPEAMRGRVMSVVVLVSRGGTHLAALQAGVLVASIGPVAAAVVGALAVAGAVGGATAASPALRGFSTSRRAAMSRATEVEAGEEVER